MLKLKKTLSFKTKALVLGCLPLLLLQLLESEWSKPEFKITSHPTKKSYLASLKSVGQNSSRTTKLGKASDVSKALKQESSVLLNDPNMSEKWGLKLTDSNAAWKITKGSKKIVVAIIDTGIDPKHEDLASNLWVNPGETGLDKNKQDKRTNGKDDDKNGYIDDVHGVSFVDNTLMDHHGHGTHISGIVGAVGGNGKGISGVSPKVSLMTLKYYDPKSFGSNNLENTVKAIHYAIENGAHIINYSGGGLEFSKAEKKAIARAQKKGILFIAAAGNERSNSDQKKYYPADYELNNIISVTAIDPLKKVLPSSNYGKITVDIAAPGENIYSTLPNGRYGRMTGTSQATAFVSGVAALLMAHNPDYNAETVAKHIQKNGDTIESLKGKTRYRKKLNSYRALSIIGQGESATGVHAINTQALPSQSFSVEKFKYKQDNPSKVSMKQFSNELMDLLKKKQRSINSSEESKP